MWFVCFCEPRRVLRLVEALVERGLRAECPTYAFRRRLPRTNKAQVVRRPLIGGVFFVWGEHWPLGNGMLMGVDLEAVKRLYACGRPALVADAELERLRMASERANEQRTSFKAGDRVEVTAGPFKGIVGTVVGVVRRERVKVRFEGWPLPVDIGAFLLRRNQA